MDPETNNLIKELKYAIEEGDIDKLKEKVNEFHLERKKICQPYISTSQCVTQTDLILAACRNKQADILHYLLNETDILDHLNGADYNDTDVQRQRTVAFKHALIWDDFSMVEMLYDYWSGDLHWNGHDINKIKTLGKLLDDARVACVFETQQLMIDVHSLILFNAFQQEIYSRISNTTPGDTATALVEILRIYDEYSDMEKVRIPQEAEEQERMLKVLFDDKSSEYMKAQVYIKYEVYFRKLDFNIALLIFEKWFSLRQHFEQRFNKRQEYFGTNPAAENKHEIENAVSLYKEIEYALYSFIYRTCEDCRLYLPRDRQITVEENHTGIHKGRIIKNLIIKYDKQKLQNGAVLYLERKSFNERLNQFKILLEKYVICKDPATNGEASNKNENIKILLDDNYLTPTKYMNDYYSLSKIVYYIEAIEDIDDRDVNVLMIERVIQVTEEMLKNTKATKHQSESTKSLVQSAISVVTIQCLHNIRTFLSKTDGGQLNTRIALKDKAPAQIFDNMKHNLKNIKHMINSVLDIYKPILDKSLLENGVHLLDERIKSMSLRYKVDEIFQCFEIHGNNVFQELSEETGLTVQLLKEIIWIRVNKDTILTKIKTVEASIDARIVSVLPTYIRNIRETQKIIRDYHKNGKLDSGQLLQEETKKQVEQPGIAREVKPFIKCFSRTESIFELQQILGNPCRG